MNRNDNEQDNTTHFRVLINHEEQYSIWPDYKETPAGWTLVGKAAPKEDCLAYIKEVWTDMRPLSLRKQMEELARKPQLHQPASPADTQQGGVYSLVDFLCEGDHLVEIGLRPERSTKLFKEAIGRNYVHIKFKDTRGGTELGFRLDQSASDVSALHPESGRTVVHLEGNLTLDYVKVKCVASIDFNTLEGKGHLVKLSSEPASVFQKTV